MSTLQTNPYRLATTVAPTHYELTLAPDIPAARFTGSATITLTVTEPVTEIQFNVADLELDPVELTDAAGALRTATATFDAAYERATLTFAEPVPAGTATLRVTFRGELNDKLIGFYRSTYVDTAGVTQTIATTQMESTDARRVFPSWDEPSFKATFGITLRVASHLRAYSNGPIVDEQDHGDGTTSVRFKDTMKMSSYLVAAIVGPFEETEPIDVDGTPLRVVCPLGKRDLGAFALEAGAHSLRFYREYFGIPYPGDKLDLVAVPDFAFGAMENLGCVTFRESALLVDPAVASTNELGRVAEVVAHELAHMWFGDLVTMAWWEGIWLNEAFATFMETLCIDQFRPEWNLWLKATTGRDVASQVDGLHATRPIEFEVIAPTDMRAMFDLLTYQKGCAVLRMCEQHLGADVFRAGIRRYLADHAYANTVTTDLWDALEAASGQPVRQMMDTWILQGGLPLVTYADGALSQTPFSYGPPRGESAIGERWLVPVGTRPLGGGAVTRVLLGTEPTRVGGGLDSFVNAGGWGVYRTRYGADELAAITSSVAKLDPIERAVLFADQWASLFARQSTWPNFLALARQLSTQDEPATWSTVAQVFDFVHRAATESQRPTIVAQLREVFAPQLARLGWTAVRGEDPLAAQVRAIAIAALGSLGADDDVRARAREIFSADAMDGDTARAVLSAVAAAGARADYETFRARLRDARTPQDEQRYQWGLAEFPGETEALETAAACFGEFRSQDGPIVLALLERNAGTGPLVWRYLKDRWDEAIGRFPPSMHSRTFSGITTFINDRPLADEVEAFHRAHPVDGEARPLEQMIERMRLGLDFADAVRGQL